LSLQMKQMFNPWSRSPEQQRPHKRLGRP
jgi:hypothetical protein